MITYLHAYFMNIAKFDTSISLFNLLMLQVGQGEYAMKFRKGNTIFFFIVYRERV